MAFIQHLFEKKKPHHEEEAGSSPKGISTIVRTYECPCHNIKPEIEGHEVLEAYTSQHTKPRVKGEFDIIFEGSDAEEKLKIFAKSKDRFNDIISPYGEVQWTDFTTQKTALGDVRHVITGFFVPGQFALKNGIADYGHFIRVALSRIYNSRSTGVNPKFQSLSSLQTLHKALSLSCTGPQVCNMHISQSITDPATLLWVIRDFDNNVNPIAWRVLNFTSSSPTQTITFYQGFGIGNANISGSSWSLNSWIESDVAMEWETYASPNNWSPRCGVDPAILVKNWTGSSQNYAIGFLNPGGGLVPDSLDVNGIGACSNNTAITLNSLDKARKYKVYCNLPSTPPQGSYFDWSLPNQNLLANNVYMGSYGTDVYFLLSESGGVYTYTQTG